MVIGGSAIDSVRRYIKECVNSCAVTAGGATGAGPTEECTMPSASAPTGFASPTAFRPSTPSAAISAPAMDMGATVAAGATSAVPPILSNSGARCSAEEEMSSSSIINIEPDLHAYSNITSITLSSARLCPSPTRTRTLPSCTPFYPPVGTRTDRTARSQRGGPLARVPAPASGSPLWSALLSGLFPPPLSA